MLKEQRQQFLKRQHELQNQIAKDESAKGAGIAAAQKAPVPRREGPANFGLERNNWKEDRSKYEERIKVQKLPVGLKMKRVVDLLFKERRLMSPGEIEELTLVDIHADEELQESLVSNVKVSVDSGCYIYKAKYDLVGEDEKKTRETLLSLIREHKDGIPFADIKDSYPTVSGDVQHLSSLGEVWVLQNTDTQEDILYPNDPKLKKQIVVDADLKELFRSIDLPRDFLDVEKELLKAGLQPATDIKSRQVMSGIPRDQRQKKPKKRRESKNRKFTNSHLPELFNMPMPPGS